MGQTAWDIVNEPHYHYHYHAIIRVGVCLATLRLIADIVLQLTVKFDGVSHRLCVV